MNYYYLDTSAHSDITTEILQPDPAVWEHEHYQAHIPYDRHPGFDPVFGKLILKMSGRKAPKRPTDFLAAAGLYGGSGFVVSEKAKGVLQRFRLPEHRFYALPPYTLEATGEIFHYHYLHILLADHYEYIDFAASTFVKTDFFGNDPQPLCITSVSHWKEIRKNLDELEEAIQEENLVMSDVFCKLDPDLFRIGFFLGSNFIVSERLKMALEAEGITGIEDFNEYSPRIDGNVLTETAAENGSITAKEPFEPRDLDDLTRKLDFIFRQMNEDEDAIYDYGEEIEASLDFLSRTNDPLQPVFSYIEKYPDAHHGAPGPFVHYLETYYGKGLEAALIASVNRNPTSETINMMYRIATDDSNAERQKYADILKSIAKNHKDAYIAQTAQDCLDDL